jgi:hypothetical protein
MAPRKHRSRRPRRARRAHKRGLKVKTSQYATGAYKTQILNVPQETPVKFQALGVSQNARIATLASCYQDYRITGIKIKFMPNLNTFGAGSTTGYIPQMLTKVLDQQPPPVWNEVYITSMAPRCHELTQKDFTVKFAPKVNMLASTTGGTGQGVMIKRSPWLATNANANTGGAWAADSTEHFGLLVFITNSAANDSIGAGYEAEVFYEFRKPLAQYTASSLGKDGLPLTDKHVEIHAL